MAPLCIFLIWCPLNSKRLTFFVDQENKSASDICVSCTGSTKTPTYALAEEISPCYCCSLPSYSLQINTDGIFFRNNIGSRLLCNAWLELSSLVF